MAMERGDSEDRAEFWRIAEDMRLMDAAALGRQFALEIVLVGILDLLRRYISEEEVELLLQSANPYPIVMDRLEGHGLAVGFSNFMDRLRLMLRDLPSGHGDPPEGV